MVLVTKHRGPWPGVGFDKDDDAVRKAGSESNPRCEQHRYRYVRHAARRHDQPDVIEDLIDSMD